MTGCQIHIELMNSSVASEIPEFLVKIMGPGSTVVAADDPKILDSCWLLLEDLVGRKDFTSGGFHLFQFAHEIPETTLGMKRRGCKDLHAIHLLLSLTREPSMAQHTNVHEFQVIGRLKPTEVHKHPKVYRMKIFAPSPLHAKSRFWYFMSKLKKMKSTTGEILSTNEIFEKKPTTVKNFGIVCRYNSRTGTHNLYKEFRDLTRNGAVHQLYMDLAARHRARFRSIQIIDVKRLQARKVQRPNVLQFTNAKVKFPLPHRRLRVANPQFKKRFASQRPATHFL